MEEEIEKQKIRSNIILEIMGKPKEYVEESMKTYIAKLKEEYEGVVVLNDKIADVNEAGEGFFSTFAEVEILCKDLTSLIGFCFDYMPSSVEIISPEKFITSQHGMTNIINDLQTKLHNLDMAIKTTKTENDFLRKNMNSLVRNIVMLSLNQKPLSLEELSKICGIKSEELKGYLDALVRLDKIKEEKNIYFLPK
jgi:hypothetical protein